MITLLLCGCLDADDDTGDEDGIEWSVPSNILVHDLAVDQVNETVDMNVSLGGEQGFKTQWDGLLTIVIVDSDGFEMYNLTWAVESKDFVIERTEEGKIDTYLPVSIPFSDIKASNDRMWGKSQRPGEWVPFVSWP